MQKFAKRSTKLVAITLIMALAITIAYAIIIKYSEKITNTATIKGYDVCLWRTDTNARVTSIAWGSLDTGTYKTTEQVFSFSQKLIVKQLGEYTGPETWHLNSTLPVGVTLTAHYYVMSDWQVWDQDLEPSVNLNNIPVRFTLTVTDIAPRGSFNFDILLQTGTSG